MILNNKVSAGQVDQGLIDSILGVLGFGFYAHSSGTQVISTLATKMEINGLGSTSTSAYLPLEIRGISELWDSQNNKITPIGIGDGYTVRIDFDITAKSGAPTELLLSLDIGGGSAPVINIVEKTIGTSKAPPYSISIGFPFFSLSTFKANGGQLFLATDTVTATITKRQISIHRISDGQFVAPPVV
jgi:hypothetical protein